MAGKTVSRLDQDGFYIPAKSALFSDRRLLLLLIDSKITFKLQRKPLP